ncbi:hypothetical protein Bequi_06275 [Brachybacterium sp. JHP9]|uniref:Uncharacterized protein n=1 Tax=Brachybacterium equifaecis TaxID=2910770 RepID=A0ABT0QZB6_9MICO|nr:hypothetical protein [Brachybacterium equifaecis]MCL6422998.1 hypothetical protein [Brachybacterium equifaecis]
MAPTPLSTPAAFAHPAAPATPGAPAQAAELATPAAPLHPVASAHAADTARPVDSAHAVASTPAPAPAPLPAASAAPLAAIPTGRAPARHRARRAVTATTALRAMDTQALELRRVHASGSSPAAPLSGSAGTSGSASRGGTAVPPGAAALPGAAAPPAATSPGPAGPSVRALRMRDLLSGGSAATGAWVLAAHLGVLGTATGTFVVSVVSAVGVAIAADSVTGLRRVLSRGVRRAQVRRRHHSRGAASPQG